MQLINRNKVQHSQGTTQHRPRITTINHLSTCLLVFLFDVSSPFTFSYLISQLVIWIVVFHVNHLCCHPQTVHLIRENVGKALDTERDLHVATW